MRAYVFGGGSRLAQRFGRTRWKPRLIGREEADVQSMSDVMHFVGKKPDVVVNCAALIGGQCARAPDHAIGVNALGAANIAMACRMNDVPLLHVSTDQVFSGGGGPKGRDAETYPTDAYGLSKLLGESAVLSIMPTDAIVLRFGWLYGVEYLGCQPMVAAMQSETSPAYVLDNTKGTPTFVGHAATSVGRAAYALALADYWKSTVIHVGPNMAPVTWYEFLGGEFDMVPMKDGTYRGTKVASGVSRPWKPAVGGLIPTEGWATPDYRSGLGEFLKEFYEAFPQKAGDRA